MSTSPSPSPRPRLVLASASPRRRDLLHQVGLAFDVEVPDHHEDHRAAADPEALARHLASGKAGAVAARHAGTPTLVLGADTVVAVDGTALGKPADDDDARRMLRLLAGRRHDVVTAYCVVDCRTGTTVVRAVTTAVWFRPLSTSEVDAYVATGEPRDKAGGYGIQGRGAVLVARVEGDYPTVVGLPVTDLALTLRPLGLDVLAVDPGSAERQGHHDRREGG